MATDFSCPDCGAQLPSRARICQKCGALNDRLNDRPGPGEGETLELPPQPVRPDPRLRSSPADRPATIHLAQRQFFGVHPVPLLAGLAGASLLIGIALLGAGLGVAGTLVLAIAVVLAALLRFAIRREPEAPLAGQIGRAADRCRSTLDLAAVIARTGFRAAVNLVRIRGRQRRLRSELQAYLKPLGEAVYRNDHARAEALKRQANQLEEQLLASQHEATAVAEAARRKIRGERTASQPTEAISTPRG